MNYSLDFSDRSGYYHLQLKEVNHPTKNIITIDKKNYKLKGNDEAITGLKSHLKTTEFENIHQFTALLQDDIGFEKKESVIFQKIIQNCEQNTVSPEERKLKQWLKAFNSGNPEKIKAFYQMMVNPHTEEDLLEDLNFYDRVQGFNLIKILTVTPGKIEALVQEECGFQEYAKLTLEIEPNEPYRVTNLSTVPTYYEPAHSVRMTNEAAAISMIKSKIKELVQQNKFSGTIIITKPGKVDPFIAESFGFANIEHNQKNRLETQFNLASMSKMFTVVAVLQLMEEGKLSLDDPIGKHLPEIKNEKMKNVTIRQLLTHTGGTGRIEGDFRKIVHPKGYIEVSKDRKPLFEAGTQWEYSNYGFVLLGAIIENVSGKEFYHYIQANIFDAAGMKQSNYQLKNELTTHTAVGYIKKKRGFVDNQDLLPMKGTPAGNSYSSGPDLIQFSNALLNGTLLKPSSLELIRTPKEVTNEEKPSQYAIGFMTGDHWFGHSGRYEGVNGELRIFPQSGYIVTILANRDPQAASNLANFIDDTLPL